MASETSKEELLAQWLSGPAGTAPPEGLDPETVQAVIAIRPDLAPPMKMTSADLIRRLTQSNAPAALQPQAAEIEPEANRHTGQEPDNVVNLADYRRWRQAAIAVVAMAAVTVLFFRVMRPEATPPPEEEIAQHQLQNFNDMVEEIREGRDQNKIPLGTERGERKEIPVHGDPGQGPHAESKELQALMSSKVSLENLEKQAKVEDYDKNWYLETENADRLAGVLSQVENLNQSGRLEEALATLDGLRQDPDTSVALEAHLRSAELLHEAGQSEKALNFLVKGQELAQENIPTLSQLWSLEGDIRRALGDDAGARLAYMQARKLNLAR